MADEEKKATFLSKVKKGLDVKLVGLVVLIIWQIGEGFWLNYQAGAEQAKYEQFKTDAKKIIDEEVAVPNLLVKIIDSEFVKRFADDKQKEIETQLIEQVLADSNEVDFITLLGMETGFRDEIVKEKFITMFKMYVDGKLMTEEQVKDLIKRRTVSASF